MIASGGLPITTKADQSSKHLVAAIRGKGPGPTLIVVGGIHGNEPAGAFAAERIAPHIQMKKSQICGEVVLLSGNIRALAQRVRYIDSDLNRHWSPQNISRVRSERSPRRKSEDLELLGLLKQFESASERARGELYFLDLHTTSAHGVPFATVGDTLRNRKFALNFPTTIVLGLEEQIEGTMLEYVNNLGAITMGFEAGQHEAQSSVDYHESVIWIALVAAGLMRRVDAPEFERACSLLEKAGGGARIVEVRSRHAIAPNDEFSMEPGFENFQSVQRGQLLAQDRFGPIKAAETGMVLLPLYQRLGDDGFFLGRKVNRFWLRLSAVLRHLRIGDYVHLLPGVRRQDMEGSSFVVNTRIARILPLQVFHLLGFRKRRWSEHVLVVSRRRYDLERPMRNSSEPS